MSWAHLFAVKQRVFVLHAHERGPAVLACHRDQVCKLPGSHRAGTDVAHFTALHEIVQRLHRFFRGDCGIIPMDLKEIDVRGLQSRKRGRGRIEDGCAGQPTLVHVSLLFLDTGNYDCVDSHIICNDAEAFRCDNDLVTRNVVLGGMMRDWHRNRRAQIYLLHQFGDDALRCAVGVDVGGIDCVDAEVPCCFQDFK